MKLAYFGIPHLGGTFSVYRQLRSGLGPSNIDVLWLGVGQEGLSALDDPAWAAERPHGVIARTSSSSEPEIARAIARTITAQQFDGVIVNVLSDRVQTNIVRYLPQRLLRIMIVHNATPGTYAAAGAVRDSVHATVCVAPRVRDDLVARYGFDPAWTFTVANGTDAYISARRDATSPSRILFVGRIEDQAKGVLWLPDIMRRLPQCVSLTIAGDGPDFGRLQRACAPLGARIRLLGAVAPADVRSLLANHDMLLMPSRFEGCPLVLLEGMAAGCVPVASQIRGITDAIVSHGSDGRLFPVGDIGAAVGEILDLVDHPTVLASLSFQAQATISDRFHTGAMAAGYRAVIERLEQDTPAIAPPLDINEWSLPSGLRPGLRTYLPRSVKNALRTMKERFAYESRPSPRHQ